MSICFEESSEPRVVFCDRSVLAVSKPPRLHSAPLRKGGGENLADWVFDHFPDAALPGFRDEAEKGKADRAAEEGGILHRLDYETSGLVLFARDTEAFTFLLAEQEAGRIVKDYFLRARIDGEGLEGSRPHRSCPRGIAPRRWEDALLTGQADSSPGEVARIVEDGQPEGGERLVVESRFRPYGPGASRVACIDSESPVSGRVLAAASDRSYGTILLSAALLHPGDASLDLEVRIFRGFRHQIRAHMAWIGLRLDGDALYCGSPAPRLCLHAHRLEFRHPVTGESCIIESS